MNGFSLIMFDIDALAEMALTTNISLLLLTYFVFRKTKTDTHCIYFSGFFFFKTLRTGSTA